MNHAWLPLTIAIIALIFIQVGIEVDNWERRQKRLQLREMTWQKLDEMGD